MKNRRDVSATACARHPSLRKTLGMCGILLLSSGAALAEQEPVSSGRTLGFVLSTFSLAINLGKDDCPQGLTLTTKDAFLSDQTPAERARLLRPENAEEFEKRYKVDFVFGADGTNICQNPERYPRKPQHMVQGSVARGLNLDGQVTAGQDFTSPTGEAGIDNQLYRAFGCGVYYRGLDENYGDWTRQVNVWLANGEHTTVVMLKGVDDFRNDPDVELVIASSADIPTVDGTQKILPWGSFTMTDNPAWKHVARGHIRDGVLTTEPIDIVLNGKLGVNNGLIARKQLREYRQARFQLTLAADGSSISGLMGAYQTITNARQLQFHSGSHGAYIGGIECSGEYWAMVEAADALPDPVTGKFTGLSIGYDVKGVAAYVFEGERETYVKAADRNK